MSAVPSAITGEAKGLRRLRKSRQDPRSGSELAGCKLAGAAILTFVLLAFFAAVLHAWPIGNFASSGGTGSTHSQKPSPASQAAGIAVAPAAGFVAAKPPAGPPLTAGGLGLARVPVASVGGFAGAGGARAAGQGTLTASPGNATGGQGVPGQTASGSPALAANPLGNTTTLSNVTSTLSSTLNNGNQVLQGALGGVGQTLTNTVNSPVGPNSELGQTLARVNGFLYQVTTAPPAINP